MKLVNDTPRLIEHVSNILNENTRGEKFFPEDVQDESSMSAVLFLLGLKTRENDAAPEPCLILNKRSKKVRQPGDLCCPGGRVSPRIDSFLSKILTLPFFPLARWPYWSGWHKKSPQQARLLALLFATSLRESFEEMQLNPFDVKFLGPHPPLSLIMTQRDIYPMVGWLNSQKKFRPNWEVDEIVYIPLEDLLNPENYRRFRIRITQKDRMTINESSELKQFAESMKQDYPGFLLREQNRQQVLWGLTYRMVITFLEDMFDFTPPEMSECP
ncbi:MAG: CoA pyrophosphatase, partial [Deltaproteobacteria bacterium]|nr:CoA pyrophosphatase [Deltaproteobacteria bacterium]